MSTGWGPKGEFTDVSPSFADGPMMETGEISTLTLTIKTLLELPGSTQNQERSGLLALIWIWFGFFSRGICR